MQQSQDDHRNGSHGGNAARRSYKRWVWPTVQIALTIAVVVWVFNDSGLLKQIGNIIAHADWRWLVAGMVCKGVSIAGAVMRWHIFMLAQGMDLSRRRTTGITLISMFFGLLIPASIGSGTVRLIYVFREAPTQRTAGATALIADHLSGLVALILLALTFTFSRLPWFEGSAITDGVLYFVAGFFVITLSGLAALFLAVETGLIDRMPRLLPWREKLIGLAKAMNLLMRQWRAALLSLVWSMICFGSFFLSFYCAGRAVGAGVSLLDMMTLMPIVDVIAGLPLTISGLGVREKLFEHMLRTQLGVANSVALSLSLTGFAFTAAWSLAGGVVFLLYRTKGSTERPHVLQEMQDVESITATADETTTQPQ